MQTRVQDAYEALYTGKSYQHEIALVDVLLERRLGKWRSEDKGQAPRRILEIGCGPGLRLAVLNQWHGRYDAEGLDRDATMLSLAAKRVPRTPLHEADIRTFDLGKSFDAVLCLFGVISYMKDQKEMTKALTAMHRHLVPGGVLLLEPWLSPDTVEDGHVRSDFAERGDMEVARMNFTKVNGNKSVLTTHYLIGDDHGVRHIEETRTRTLFTEEEYRGALRDAGFGDVGLEAYGPQGRGLYVAEN
jgi:SAM-dependent methyltransferase